MQPARSPVSRELALLGELLRLVERRHTSLELFRERVASLPWLAARIVRIANSPLYGMAGKITRLERAVLILGPHAVASMATTVIAARALRDVSLPGAAPDAALLHALEIGVCAQLLARSLIPALEHDAYRAGVLHDIGMVELYRSHGTRYRALLERARLGADSLAALEREAFGTAHPELLAAVAAASGFPGRLCRALRHYPSPLAAPESTRGLAALLHAAVRFASDRGGWCGAAETNGAARVLSDLGLAPTEGDELRAAVGERLKDVVAALCAPPERARRPSSLLT